MDEAQGAETRIFEVGLNLGLKLKVEVGPESISWKQGVRARVQLPLGKVRYFGHRRPPDGVNTIVELVFVSATGDKLPKLPMNPASPGAQALLAHLAERLPTADVSGLPWLEAAPLLGMKAFGFGAMMRHPLFGAGLVLLVLGGPVSFIARQFMSRDELRYQGLVVAIAMGIGAVMMVLGWRRVREQQRAEEDAAARRAQTRVGR